MIHASNSTFSTTITGSFLRFKEGQFSLPFHVVVDGEVRVDVLVDDLVVDVPVDGRVDVPVDVGVDDDEPGVALPDPGAQRLSPYPLDAWDQKSWEASWA